MKTIAAEAGVSVMTVSLALRNHPRISRKTRERVQDAAARLGYKSNPMVVSLMTHIRASRPVAYQANLGFLIDDPGSWKGNAFLQNAYEGVIERAQELGFKVDVFALDEHRAYPGRLEKVLESRNIQGVIFAPLKKAGSLDELDCSHWSAVALGNSVLSPRLHRVTHHQMHGMQLILQSLVERGYRRIGLAIEDEVDQKVDRSWSSCVSGFHLRIPAKQRVPVFLGKLDGPALSVWLKKHRPEVVVGHDGLFYCLKALGIRVPQDVSYACVSVSEGRPTKYAGLNQNWKIVGAAAVDSVVAQIYRNERGIPEGPKTIMLEGYWVDGPTAPTLQETP